MLSIKSREAAPPMAAPATLSRVDPVAAIRHVKPNVREEDGYVRPPVADGAVPVQRKSA